MTRALAAASEGMPANKAAILYGVPKSTLKDRLSGRHVSFMSLRTLLALSLLLLVLIHPPPLKTLLALSLLLLVLIHSPSKLS